MGGAALLGFGSVKGRLFDLGAFPGADVTTDGSSLVRGDLYRLPSAENAFRALDVYEGCGSASPEPQRFVREVAQVQLDGGGIARAWV